MEWVIYHSSFVLNYNTPRCISYIIGKNKIKRKTILEVSMFQASTPEVLDT